MLVPAQQSNPSYFRNPVPGYGFECIYSLLLTTKVLETITAQELYQDLSHNGVVIYRDFGDSLDYFNDFVSAHSAGITFDPARKTATSNTAEINANSLGRGLHRKNWNLPFNPDLQSFLCLEAASIRSETTMCDGQHVLFDLSPKTRPRKNMVSCKSALRWFA